MLIFLLTLIIQFVILMKQPQKSVKYFGLNYQNTIHYKNEAVKICPNHDVKLQIVKCKNLLTMLN